MKYITYGTYTVIKDFYSDGLSLLRGDKLKVIDIWKADKAVCFHTINREIVVIAYKDLEKYIEKESLDSPEKTIKPIIDGMILYFRRLMAGNR